MQGNAYESSAPVPYEQLAKDEMAVNKNVDSCLAAVRQETSCPFEREQLQSGVALCHLARRRPGEGKPNLRDPGDP